MSGIYTMGDGVVHVSQSGSTEARAHFSGDGVGRVDSHIILDDVSDSRKETQHSLC